MVTRKPKGKQRPLVTVRELHLIANFLRDAATLLDKASAGEDLGERAHNYAIFARGYEAKLRDHISRGWAFATGAKD